MKHKIFALVAVAMVAVAGVNAYKVSVSDVEMLDLQKENVEALAGVEINPWYLWFSQGLTADEQSEPYICDYVLVEEDETIDVNASGDLGNGLSGNVNYSSHRKAVAMATNVKAYKCIGGTTNCSKVTCSDMLR